jgi:hypothetical protein
LAGPKGITDSDYLIFESHREPHLSGT